MSTTVNMPNEFDATIRAMCEETMKLTVSALAAKYEFDTEEANRFMDASPLKIVRKRGPSAKSEEKKSVTKEAKAKKKAEQAEDDEAEAENKGTPARKGDLRKQVCRTLQVNEPPKGLGREKSEPRRSCLPSQSATRQDPQDATAACVRLGSGRAQAENGRSHRCGRRPLTPHVSPAGVEARGAPAGLESAEHTARSPDLSNSALGSGRAQAEKERRHRCGRRF